MERFYFDHNASAPMAPEVLEAMLPVLRDVFGNASSVHHFGQEARGLLDGARRSVASLLQATPEEIVFTGSATEADNLALAAAGGGHIVTTAIEHPAVLMAARAMGELTIVPVDGRGVVDPDAIRHAIEPETALVSVMHANNETGAVQPVEEIAKIAREAGVLFHVDGVQALGRVPVNVAPFDLYSISGHKLAGPKGIGALYCRKKVKLNPMLIGGAHERGRRAGTENVAAAVGLGRAVEWLAAEGAREAARQAALRDRLEQTILDRIADAQVNGAGAPRIPNTSNVRFDGIDSDALLIALDLRGFAVSSGAACSSGATEPSHVLLALGLSKEQARSSIRISLGRVNTEEQVDRLVEALVASVAHLRKLSPAYA